MINIDTNLCYIVAACKDGLDDIYFTPKKGDFVIAADGGYDILKKKHIDADILLGDFDSIQEAPTHTNIIKYPSQKDDTDTFLSYKLGMDKGYKNFIIFGGIGGRIDHTIANIRTLSHIAEMGGRGFLIGNGAILTSICDSSIAFPSSYSGYISVFANGNDAEGITICGLKYCANDISLKSSNSLGVSNEFVGERAEISVKKGNLLVVWYESTDSFLKNIDNFI